MDEAAWGALALTLTLLGGLYTCVAYQRRGLTAALRGRRVTLLPVAAWLTGVLKLLTEIGDAVGDWAARPRLQPVAVVGPDWPALSVVLFVVSGFLADRGVGATPKQPQGAEGRAQALPAGEAPAATPSSPLPPRAGSTRRWPRSRPSSASAGSRDAYR